MFIPLIPDLGVDVDQIVTIEKDGREIIQAQMESDLRKFVQYLVQGNEAWGKWGQVHPEDLPRYRVWFQKASHLQGRVIPSMAFDFSYMPLEHVKDRFQMIKQIVLELTLQVPSLSAEKV